MPPHKAKENTSTASNEAAAVSVPSTTTSEPDETFHTPERDPTKKAAAGITQAQKQALIDNLQLEITERARKLRAQYAMQAQHLRERLEMRINRIPSSLRNRKMQDLLDEHAEKGNPKPAPTVPVEEQKTVDEPATKDLKRQSDQISTTEDEKENDSQDLPNPKKRAKANTTTTTNTANTKASRTASRKGAVLSPKSHNSRLPRSPVRPTAAPTEKTSTQLPRPASPAKPLPALPAKGGATRTASRQQQTKRNAGEHEEGRSSEASNASAETMIVKKGGTKPQTAAGKKQVAAPAKGTAAGKKPAATAAGAKKENVPPAGGRSLRKRA